MQNAKWLKLSNINSFDLEWHSELESFVIYWVVYIFDVWYIMIELVDIDWQQHTPRGVVVLIY